MNHDYLSTTKPALPPLVCRFEVSSSYPWNIIFLLYLSSAILLSTKISPDRSRSFLVSSTCWQPQKCQVSPSCRSLKNNQVVQVSPPCWHNNPPDPGSVCPNSLGLVEGRMQSAYSVLLDIECARIPGRHWHSLCERMTQPYTADPAFISLSSPVKGKPHKKSLFLMLKIRENEKKIHFSQSLELNVTEDMRFPS